MHVGIRLTFVPEPFAATLSIFLTKNENAKKLQIASSQFISFVWESITWVS